MLSLSCTAIGLAAHAPLLRTTSHVVPFAPKLQAVASGEAEAPRPPTLGIFDPKELLAVPEPIVPTPSAEPILPFDVDHLVPLDVHTLELPKGIEMPQPIKPAAEPPAPEPTKLPSLRELAVFCLPTLGIWLSSPLLSLIDTSVVGMSCATHHLAALAPSTKLCDYTAYFCTVLGMATTNLAADAFAHERPAAAKRIIASSLCVALVLGGAVAALIYANAGALMGLMLGSSATSNAPLLAAAADYTSIRALGYPAALLTMVLQAGFIACKDATTPLLAVPITALVNLLGDLVLVAPLGAAGAAWATTGALYANALTLLAFWRRKMKTLGGEDVLISRPSMPELKNLLAFALPMMTAMVARVYMGLSITLSAVALGTTALAANQVIESLYWLFCPFGEAISLCMQAYLPPLLMKGRSLARRLQQSALKAASGLGTFAAASAVALPLAAPGLFTSSSLVAGSMAASAPALAFALFTYVLSSANEGMLIARKQLRWLAVCNVANTALLSVAMRAALRVPGCALQHVWVLFGACNVLRIAEFSTLLARADRDAVTENVAPKRRWRLRMRALRQRVERRRAEDRQAVHDAIPDVSDIAPHLT